MEFQKQLNLPSVLSFRIVVESLVESNSADTSGEVVEHVVSHPVEAYQVRKS